MKPFSKYISEFNKYRPTENKPTTCIQAKMEKNFMKEVKAQARKDGIKIKELVKIGMQKYLDESKGEKTES